MPNTNFELLRNFTIMMLAGICKGKLYMILDCTTKSDISIGISETNKIQSKNLSES